MKIVGLEEHLSFLKYCMHGSLWTPDGGISPSSPHPKEKLSAFCR